MKKLKVGVICYPSLGGSGVVATELGIMMADRGHEMHYITSSIPFRFLDAHPNIHFHEVTIDGYSVFKYPPYDIALANRIAQVIESENLDLLHVHYAVPHAVSAALGKDMANQHWSDYDITRYRRNNSRIRSRHYEIQSGMALISQQSRLQFLNHLDKIRLI